jgi:hypothetical protein
MQTKPTGVSVPAAHEMRILSIAGVQQSLQTGAGKAIRWRVTVYAGIGVTLPMAKTSMKGTRFAG